MQEYKQNIFKSHRNLIILLILFTAILGVRLWFDYNYLKPVYIPVLKDDMEENIYIDKSHIQMKTFYKLNLSSDVITNKTHIINMYTNSYIPKGLPIVKKQVISSSVKYGYLDQLDKDRRVIPLPSDVNSSGINIDNIIEITSSKSDLTDSSEDVFVQAIVRDKIDAKGISYDSKRDETRENVPKVLMVEVSQVEAKNIEDAIALRKSINVRLVPPSSFMKEAE